MPCLLQTCLATPARLQSMVAFDTAKVERALRAPLGDEAAREVTTALAEGLTDHIATKADIEQLRDATKADIEQLRDAMKADIEKLHIATTADIEQLRSELRQSEQRIFIRLGGLALTLAGIGFAGMGVATTLILRAV